MEGIEYDVNWIPGLVDLPLPDSVPIPGLNLKTPETNWDQNWDADGDLKTVACGNVLYILGFYENWYNKAPSFQAIHEN